MTTAQIDTFKDIPDQMLWKGPALHQIENFRKLTQRLGYRWATVGHHFSKSIKLPVVRISRKGLQFYLRDNFYDINLCAVSKEPITVPMSVLFEGVLTPQTWDWYLNEISRSRGYSWSPWTDAQMDDPDLLTVDPDPEPRRYTHMTKEPGEKARWLRRMMDPTWYSHDWSSGVICWEEDFGPGAKLYIQEHPYLEGISSIVPKKKTQPYVTGCKGFAVALSSLEQAEALIRRLTAD